MSKCNGPILRDIKKQMIKVIDTFINNSYGNLKRDYITTTLNKFFIFNKSKEFNRSYVYDNSFSMFSEDDIKIFNNIQHLINIIKFTDGLSILKEMGWLDKYNTLNKSNIKEYECLLDGSQISNTYKNLINVGVYYLNRNNSFLPLHDHPGMLVISKCIYGELRATSMSPIKNDSEIDIDSFSYKNYDYQDKKEQDKSMLKFSKSSSNSIYLSNNKGIEYAKLEKKSVLKYNNIDVVYPLSCNLHEISLNSINKKHTDKNIDEAVLFDVFIPHYIPDKEEYSINYYTAIDNFKNFNSKTNLKLMKFV